MVLFAIGLREGAASGVVAEATLEGVDCPPKLNARTRKKYVAFASRFETTPELASVAAVATTLHGPPLKGACSILNPCSVFDVSVQLTFTEDADTAETA